ncbi:mediator of RNA polymerase II transcription subunit 28 isoform X2 [Dendroctonus ponderosae]|uniref:mediator of RNA polymerase II transcription subunit 28 isoform X2 n=1 Tax=Dendroctonus ponderosae TaxID=77166 RepID=UPI002034F3FA|nr:mediator of RNA polymerase II transcription subunit 28 isoform X2 [Dendroctonus ponderosae]
MNPLKEPSPPGSAMATPTNTNGNLVDEFEEAFQSCLNVLTKEEAVPATDKDEIKVEVEHTMYRFIDMARQMEAYFLQKRFLLSALKPEINIKEDVNDLRIELVRKEELIKRHYEKIAVWQNLLADLHSYAKSPAQAGGNSTPSGAGSSGSSILPSPVQSLAGNQPTSQLMSSMPTSMQQLQHQQLQQQHQQLQQQQLQQMQMQQMQTFYFETRFLLSKTPWTGRVIQNGQSCN